MLVHGVWNKPASTNSVVYPQSYFLDQIDPSDLFLCFRRPNSHVPGQTLSTSDLRMSLESVGVNVRSIFERSDLVRAALDAGIDKLPTGDVVVRESSPRRAVNRRTGGLATVEPLEVNGVDVNPLTVK